MHSIKLEAIGTLWQIDSTKPFSKRTISSINDLISDFESSFSRFKSNSWVTKVYNNPGKHRLPPFAFEILSLYTDLYLVTEGKITPLIGSILEEAGYDSEYSLKPKKIYPILSFTEAIQYDREQITTRKPTLLDFGALGKGFLIDLITKVLKKEGHESFVIDGSGDILSFNQTLNVGLENPFDTSKVIGAVTINNSSICASSGNRRKWGSFHHIIDPYTLESPSSVSSSWTISKSAAIADSLATALFLADPEKLSFKFDFEYLILYKSGDLRKSEGFEVELFI